MYLGLTVLTQNEVFYPWRLRVNIPREPTANNPTIVAGSGVVWGMSANSTVSAFN